MIKLTIWQRKNRNFVLNALIQAKISNAVNQLAAVSPPSADCTRQMCKAIAPAGAAQVENVTPVSGRHAEFHLGLV